MATSLGNFLWYAKKGYWPHVLERVARHTFLRSGYEKYADRERAKTWASERAVSVSEALETLGFSTAGGIPRIDPEVLAEAEKRAATSKVPMGGPGDLDLLYAATVLSRARRVVETGVAYGWSSFAILLAFEENALADAKLVSVDMPYANKGNEAFVGIVVPDELRHRWELIREPDRNGLRKAIAAHGGQVDLCHYDSDKSVYGRAYAYELMWRALRPGGVFISDDIQDNLWFAHFSETSGQAPVVTQYRGKFVGALRKP